MIHFQNLYLFFLLWLVLPIIFLFYYSVKKKRKAIRIFTGGKKNSENSFQLKGYINGSILIIISILFIVFALVRPSWNKETKTIEKRGRDVVFLIDVSKSMLADDLIPNRLERAKLAINDAVLTLNGDRVALVAFAGSAVVKTPLTNDYSFFISSVERLNVNSVSRGGSLIGDAIRYVYNNVLDDSAKAYKDIILITDGEDHESFPVEAAAEAGKKGIRIIAIGLGDEKKGHRIPVSTDSGTEFMTFNGEEIWSHLDADSLRKIAGATEGGQYLNVSTGTFDLAEIYGSLIAGSGKAKYEDDSHTVYEERFQFFLFISILFLAIALFQPFRGFRHFISIEDKKIITNSFKKKNSLNTGTDAGGNNFSNGENPDIPEEEELRAMDHEIQYTPNSGFNNKMDQEES